MKIAMFFSSDPSSPGGVQEHILNLSRGLENKGHQIDIFGPNGNIYPFKHYHEVGSIITTPVINGNWGNILFSNRNKMSLIKKLNQYDLLHIHEPYTPFLAFDLIKETTVTKITTFHTAWNDGSLINIFNTLIPLFKDFFSGYIKGAIFVSKASYLNWQPLLDKKIKRTVIYNGIDTKIYTTVRKKKRSHRLLFVGRLVPRKGISYLLNAFVELKNKYTDLKLTIIGEGPQKKEVLDFIENNSLKEAIDFVGALYGKDKIKYYQQADIFCAPYTDEAFGITILEALATGLPVCGFNNRAFEEIFSTYPKPSSLVRFQDIKSLIKAIDRLLSNSSFYHHRVSLGLEVAKNYDWQKQVKRTLDFYSQCR